MRKARAAAGLAIFLSLLMLLTACTDEPADNGGNDDSAGAPLNRDDDNEAARSPLDIPAFTNSQGQPVEDVREELEEKIREQCGGSLCVTIRVEPADTGLQTRCQFYTTDPPPGSQVDRDGVVVILTGPNPCEEESGPDSETSAEPEPSTTSP